MAVDVTFLLLSGPNSQTNNKGKSRGTLGNLWSPLPLSSDILDTHTHTHTHT